MERTRSIGWDLYGESFLDLSNPYNLLIGRTQVTLFGLVFLYYIDGLPINSFTGPAQPTVIVALAGTLAGMTLTFALSVGVDISFWKAAQRGTTVCTNSRLCDRLLTRYSSCTRCINIGSPEVPFGEQYEA